MDCALKKKTPLTLNDAEVTTNTVPENINCALFSTMKNFFYNEKSEVVPVDEMSLRARSIFSFIGS